MTSVTSEITNMQNQTAFYKLAQDKQNATSRNPKTENDSNMFLTLMLKLIFNVKNEFLTVVLFYSIRTKFPVNEVIFQ